MKNILITGSTDGIGKLVALKLAKDGHRVYIHGRNTEKLASVISEIKSETKNEHIGGFTADLSELKAVKTLAKDIMSNTSKLDILINNAGVYNSPIERVGWGISVLR